MNAKGRNLENIFCGTLNDFIGLAGQVDSLGAFDVIEHIKDDDKFVKGIHDVLKKDGTFFVTIPAFKFLWSNEDKDAGHYRRYNRITIVKLLANNGFDIIYSSYFFSFLILPLYIIRTLPYKLRIRNKSKTQTQNEHNQNRVFFGKMFNSILKWELRRIQQQIWNIMFNSCNKEIL